MARVTFKQSGRKKGLLLFQRVFQPKYFLMAFLWAMGLDMTKQ